MAHLHQCDRGIPAVVYSVNRSVIAGPAKPTAYKNETRNRRTSAVLFLRREQNSFAQPLNLKLILQGVAVHSRSK